MNLKFVAAAMSLLGLVSCPMIAVAATVSTTTTVKHHHKIATHSVKHKTKVRKRRKEATSVARISYKDEMPAAGICAISQSAIILDETTQNVGRALPNPCNPDWADRISVSGGVNLDLSRGSRRNADIQGENTRRFSLNDVYVNIGANVNSWTKAFASISYSNTTPTGGNDSDHYGYSSVYRDNTLSLEQAYFTIANFEVSPIFLQVGKQFTDFSQYEIHPITRSMTQVLSEALTTTAKLGVIFPLGFHGSLYIFDDPIKKINSSVTSSSSASSASSLPIQNTVIHPSTNYGITLGYKQVGDQYSWDLGSGYVYNMMAAEDVAHAVTNFTGSGYHTRAGAVAAYADINTGPFSVNARWTGAVQRFNPNDLPKNGIADQTHVDDVINPHASGAKPWAAGIQAGYGFEAFGCRSNNIYLGYQASREAASVGVPRGRWLAGYGIEVWKQTNFGLEWDHDSAYNVSNGGTGNTTNLVSLRAGVQFG